MNTPRIISDPAVMVGKPVIEGTRLTVEHILGELAQGLTIEDLLTNYPRLTREGIQAAMAYAKDVMQTVVVYPVHPKAA